MSDQHRIEFHQISEERNTFRGSFGHSFGGTLGQGLGCIALVIISIVLLAGGTVCLVVWLASTSRSRQADEPIAAKNKSKIIEEKEAGPAEQAKPVEKAKPPAPKTFATRSTELAAALIDASPDRRKDLLATYRDGKGPEFTEALAKASAKLTGEPQIQVRDALVLRLTRMTVATLNNMLRDVDHEIRQAAAAACGSKGDKSLIHELIRLIAEDDPVLVQTARASLKSITAEDLGPGVGALPSDRLHCVLAWRKWEQAQQK